MSKENLYLGFDISKLTFDVAINNQKAMCDFPKKAFSRDKKGFKEFVKWAKSQGVLEGVAVMEATGRYSAELAMIMLNCKSSFKPSIVDAYQIYHFAKSIRARNKNDQLDAKIISVYGKERKPKIWEPPAPEYLELQELVRLREFTIKQRTDAQKRLNEVKDTPAVYKLAKKVFNQLEKGEQEVDDAIKNHIEKHPVLAQSVELGMSIPGVGFITMVNILGELGDLRRFKSSRQLSAYVGLSPCQYQSGTSINGKSRMSKSGNRNARKALYFPAIAATRAKGTHLSKFYNNLVEQGKAKLSAIGAVMRKLLLLIRAILISQVEYKESLVGKNNY